jgi:hypothetical protein
MYLILIANKTNKRYFPTDPTASVHKIVCKSWEKCDTYPDNDEASVQGRKREACTAVSMEEFRDESVRRARLFQWRSPNTPRPKEARLVKSKVKNMLIISLT